MEYIFQKTLFDEKGDFNPKEFNDKCINDTFIKCVRNGIKTAVEKVSSLNLQIMLRVKSDALHDVAFSEIQNRVSCTELHDKIYFKGDISGNNRLFFSYDDYIFVLRKKGSNGNKSEIENVVNSQKADKHIIIIEYGVNSTWEAVSSISFQYIRNDISEMCLYIPLEDDVNVSIDVPSSEVEEAKVVLKTTERKAE